LRKVPNRYVDWEQPTFEQEPDIEKSRLWLGNHYASRFDSALAVAEYVRDNIERFDDAAEKFRIAMYDSTLPTPVIDAASSQISVLRSPTCFRDASMDSRAAAAPAPNTSAIRAGAARSIARTCGTTRSPPRAFSPGSSAR